MPRWRRALPWASAAALLTACATDELVVGDEVPDAAIPGDAALPGDGAPDAAPGDAGLAPDAAPPSPTVGDDYLAYAGLVPDADGEIALRFDTPPDATSFVLTADPGPSPRAIELMELKGPDGETRFDVASDAEQPFEPVLRSSLAPEFPYGVMLPSSPASAFEPGPYEVRLRIASGDRGVRAEPVAVDVVFQRRAAGAAPRPRALSLALWFVPGLALDAEAAAADAQLGAAIDEASAIFAAAEIELADVQYRDLTAAEGYERLADDAALAELLAMLAADTSAQAVPALDILFVDRIQSSGKTVRGKTTGLPGPPAHPQLARRGAVVIALSSLPSAAGAAGELLAHESAHYLGLRHTSEFDGLRHDPIADTPECPVDRASAESSDGTPLLTADDCEDLDGRNLLFYTPALTFPQRELTPGQAYVLARHPLAR